LIAVLVIRTCICSTAVERLVVIGIEEVKVQMIKHCNAAVLTKMDVASHDGLEFPEFVHLPLSIQREVGESF